MIPVEEVGIDRCSPLRCGPWPVGCGELSEAIASFKVPTAIQTLGKSPKGTLFLSRVN